MTVKRATKVELVGRGIVTLAANDHVATGGEGSVYRKGDTIIKIYTDPGKMQRDGMTDKIGRLAAIKHEFIVSPRGLVLDSTGSPVGYYMDFADGEPLTRIFTNDFRKHRGFGDSDASKLVDRMRQTMLFAHDHDAIMVDANELNWLALVPAKAHDPKPRVLDVDSWVLDGNIPPTVAKMPSIRDWHGHLVSIASDWFAWAVVTFQIYTGIHPYKGTLAGYLPSDLQRRMVDNASVFNLGVRLNRAVRDFSCVPARLLSWYQDAFQHGRRETPPSPFDTTPAASKAVKVMRATTTSKAAAGLLVYERLLPGDDSAISVFPCGVALLASGRLVDLSSKRDIGKVSTTDCKVVRVGRFWLVYEGLAPDKHSESHFHAIDTTSLATEQLPLNATGSHVLLFENRMFLVTDRGLAELQLRDLGRPILTAAQPWGVMVNSTQWFDGVGVQDSMGATFVIAPFGPFSVAQVRVRELDGLRPVAAKAGERFVSVIAVDPSGQYTKVELTFDREYKTYTAWQGGTQTPDLNMTMLPKGVGVTIVDDGELTIFVPSNGKVSKVADKDIATDMVLGHYGDVVVVIWDGAVWTIRTK